MEKNQENFWDGFAEEYDKIYSGNTNLVMRALNRVLRRNIYRRFDYTFAKIGEIEGREFLDVACGSGEYSIELALRGAEHITAIDISGKMLDLCQAKASENNVEDKLSYVHGSIYDCNSIADVTIVMGLFDYIHDPLSVLRQMRKKTLDKLVISFPDVNNWRTPLRKKYFANVGVDVFFYNQEDVRSLLVQSYFDIEHFDKVGSLFCVVASPN